MTLRQGKASAQGQNGEINAGATPNVEKKSLYDAAQLNPKGSCEADKVRRNTCNINIATYNTRTLNNPADLDRLLEEVENLKWEVIGLCETKKSGEGLTELPDGTWLYESGKTEEMPQAKGMAFLVNRKFTDYIEKFETHTDRIISCKIKLEKESIHLVQVYAPTTSYEEEEIEKFYEDLEKAIHTSPSYYTIIMGDFNAKIGIKDEKEEIRGMGPHGIGTRNERGERLINFTEGNRFYITNTLFKKAKKRYWTWESPNGEYRNQIDFILSSDRRIIQDCSVITSVDIGSDHRMLRAKIKINRRLKRLKRIKRQKPLKINTSNLELHEEMFQLELKNRFRALEDKENPPSIETLHKVIKEEAEKILQPMAKPTKEKNRRRQKDRQLRCTEENTTQKGTQNG